MKQFMLTLIFVSIALCGMAQAPRLTRSQLKQMPVVKDHTVKFSATAAKDKPLSLQQVMKESVGILLNLRYQCGCYRFNGIIHVNDRSGVNGCLKKYHKH